MSVELEYCKRLAKALDAHGKDPKAFTREATEIANELQRYLVTLGVDYRDERNEYVPIPDKVDALDMIHQGIRERRDPNMVWPDFDSYQGPEITSSIPKHENRNPDAIYFWKIKELYGEFSNFSRYSITEIASDGMVVEYMTSEHYFQAKKFIDPELQAKVREAENPMASATLGRTLSPLRPDWNEVRVDVMRTALRLKFEQHEFLKDLLLATEDREIVEYSNSDSYWGCGPNFDGENMLGKLLMELRSVLRDSEPVRELFQV